MKPRLYTKYVQEVVPALKASRGYANLHQVPRIEKIVLNMGVRSDAEKGSVEEAARELGMITGRKPVITKAKKSVANFKLREGQAIGCKVTLRREVMYEFWTAWSPRPSRESGISAGCPRGNSTDGERIRWGSPTRPSFPKLNSTRSSGSRAWT